MKSNFSGKDRYRQKDLTPPEQQARELYAMRQGGLKGISKSELFILLKESGYLVTEQTKLDILHHLGPDKNRYDLTDINIITNFLAEKTEQAENDESDVDYYDAFVAMGGEPLGEGVVLKARIEQVIKEFELTIDIDEFLDKIPGEELNFEEFRELFENADDETKSVLSTKSLYSERFRRTQGNFHVSFRDFEKFIAKNPNYLSA